MAVRHNPCLTAQITTYAAACYLAPASLGTHLLDHATGPSLADAKASTASIHRRALRLSCSGRRLPKSTFTRMPYKYHPLARSDIRLLTLEPGSSDPAIPICCTLDHVSRPRISNPAPGKCFKGDGHVWPETQKLHDPVIIFKAEAEDRARRHHPPPGPYTPWEPEDDARLPWRHAFGDYVALSYVWGAPVPKRCILINNHQFPVSPNLFDALIQLRQSRRIHQGFKIWVDAICINQADTEERSEQVSRMRDIYESAWQVVIWLGREADNSELAFAALSSFASFSRTDTPLGVFAREPWQFDARPLFLITSVYEMPLRRSVYEALFFLFTRPYWQRLWVLQEVAMARSDAPVLCGSSCITWRDIHDASLFIAQDESSLGRDIVASARPRIITNWSNEFGRSRVISERQWASERMWELLVEIMSLQRNQKQPRSRGFATEIFRPLLLGRDASVSEEKDRIYGLLGFKEIACMVTTEPNYKLPLDVIYLEFTTRILTTGNFNILRLVSRSSGLVYARRSSGEPKSEFKNARAMPVVRSWISSNVGLRKKIMVGTECLHGLPSWAVCWTCKPAPTAQLRAPYEAAGSMSPVSMTFGAGLSFLTSGYIVDTVGSLSAFYRNEADRSYPLNTFPTDVSLYGDLESTRDAFWRTIVADTTNKGRRTAPESYSALLDPRMWGWGIDGVYNNGFSLRDLMARNFDLILCGYTLKQLIFGRKKGFLWQDMLRTHPLMNATKEQLEAISWAVNCTAWRRILGTENGRMGLGPAATRAGDAVAILPGCDTPLILRESGDGWTVVGECYIHGVMYGEVVEMFREPSPIRLY